MGSMVYSLLRVMQDLHIIERSEFESISGALFWGLYNKDPTILGYYFSETPKSGVPPAAHPPEAAPRGSHAHR